MRGTTRGGKVNRIVPSFPQHSKITIMARKPRLTPAQRRQLIEFILERKVNGKVPFGTLKDAQNHFDIGYNTNAVERLLGE